MRAPTSADGTRRITVKDVPTRATAARKSVGRWREQRPDVNGLPLRRSLGCPGRRNVGITGLRWGNEARQKVGLSNFPGGMLDRRYAGVSGKSAVHTVADKDGCLAIAFFAARVGHNRRDGVRGRRSTVGRRSATRHEGGTPRIAGDFAGTEAATRCFVGSG